MGFGAENKSGAAQKGGDWREFFLGGLSGCAAAVCTHPIDTVKVRMQLSAMGARSATQAGFMKTIASVSQNEGIMALYKGLSASLLRQASYTTTRIGLYLKLKDKITKGGEAPMPFYQVHNAELYVFNLLKKVGASMLAGAGGALVGSPADVVLVRMQADGRLPPEQRRNYKNAFDGLFRIVKAEGVTTLWRGSMPNVNRAMLMTAGQLASYDQAKLVLLESGLFKDNIITHFTASTIAGFVAATITSPVDVIKTRIMNQKKGDAVQYKNSFDCAAKILTSEGPQGFYKGFIPYFTRLAPQTILTLIFFEQFANLLNYVLPPK